MHKNLFSLVNIYYNTGKKFEIFRTNFNYNVDDEQHTGTNSNTIFTTHFLNTIKINSIVFTE